MAGELHVVVAERPLLVEEDENEAGCVVAGLERHDEERPEPAGRPEAAPALREPLVAGHRGRGQELTVRCSEAERVGILGEPLLQCRAQRVRQVVRADDVERAPSRHHHRRERAAERLARGLRERVEGRRERQRLTEHGRDAVEAALDLEPALVLDDELRSVDAEPELARERFDERDVDVGPAAGGRAVDREHPDALPEDQDRRREHGAGSHLQHPLRPSGVRLAKRGRGRDVGDRHRRAAPYRQVRGSESRDVRAIERLEAGREPLRLERQASVGIAQADEAPVRVERRGDLLHRAGQHRVEIGVRPDLLGEARDGNLACARRPRAEALEDRPRLGRERLQPREVFASEGVLVAHRADREYTDHLLRHEHRYVGDALDAAALDEARADALRGPRVVDGERRGVVVRAGDARRLRVEVDPHLAEPVDRLPALDHRDAMGCAGGLVDERDRRDLDVRERVRAVGDRAGRLVDRLGGSQAPELLGRTGEPRRGQHQRALAEAGEERDHRDESDQDRDEPGPAAAPDGLPVAQDQEAEDDRGDADTGEEERECELELAERAAGADEHREEREARGQVGHPEHEQGDCIEVDGLPLGCHWAGCR